MKVYKNINVFNIFKISYDIFYIFGSFGSQFVRSFFNLKENILIRFFIKNIILKKKFFFKKLIGYKSGWRLRLKLEGRGISFFKRNNYIYMNIGRSHIVRFFVNNCLKIASLKKKISIMSFDFNYLRKISIMLITAQPPLIYKLKGLTYEYYNYKIKSGKVKQYRV